MFLFLSATNISVLLVYPIFLHGYHSCICSASLGAAYISSLASQPQMCFFHQAKNACSGFAQNRCHLCLPHPSWYLQGQLCATASLGIPVRRWTVPAPCYLAYKQWQKALTEWHECISYTDTKVGIIKTWGSVTKWEKGFCVTEMKKKVSFETLVSRDSDSFCSFCSCIDSGTEERKQITLYLADSFHLLIRSLSYCSAIGPGSLLWELMVWRICVQPPRRGILHVLEEAADLLQMLSWGGRWAFVN